MAQFNHFDENGNAVMVDVSDKAPTKRTAAACGRITMTREAFELVRSGGMEKGDVLGVARVAGIMAVKKTSSLIPMCHPLSISKCSVDFHMDDGAAAIDCCCEASLFGVTGVEMEALTGVSVALLTVYDMCKAVDKGMVISDIRLISKTGGKSGDYSRKGG